MSTYTREDVEKFLNTQRGRELMSALSRAESGADYNALWGSRVNKPRRFDSFDDHPANLAPREAFVDPTDNVFRSAAGAFQIIQESFNRAADAGVLDPTLPKFAPYNQQLAAAWLLLQSGGVDLEGNVVGGAAGHEKIKRVYAAYKPGMFDPPQPASTEPQPYRGPAELMPDERAVVGKRSGSTQTGGSGMTRGRELPPYKKPPDLPYPVDDPLHRERMQSLIGQMEQARPDLSRADQTLQQFEAQDVAPTAALPPVFDPAGGAGSWGNGLGAVLAAAIRGAGGEQAVLNDRQALMQSAQMIQQQIAQNMQQQGLHQLRKQNVATARAGLQETEAKLTFEQQRAALQARMAEETDKNRVQMYVQELKYIDSKELADKTAFLRFYQEATSLGDPAQGKPPGEIAGLPVTLEATFRRSQDEAEKAGNDWLAVEYDQELIAATEASIEKLRLAFMPYHDNEMARIVYQEWVAKLENTLAQALAKREAERASLVTEAKRNPMLIERIARWRWGGLAGERDEQGNEKGWNPALSRMLTDPLGTTKRVGERIGSFVQVNPPDAETLAATRERTLAQQRTMDQAVMALPGAVWDASIQGAEEVLRQVENVADWLSAKVSTLAAPAARQPQIGQKEHQQTTERDAVQKAVREWPEYQNLRRAGADPGPMIARDTERALRAVKQVRAGKKLSPEDARLLQRLSGTAGFPLSPVELRVALERAGVVR